MALSYTPTSLGLTSTQKLCNIRTSLVVRSVSKASLGFGFRTGLVPLAQHSFRNTTILPFAASHEESVSDIHLTCNFLNGVVSFIIILLVKNEEFSTSPLLSKVEDLSSINCF